MKAREGGKKLAGGRARRESRDKEKRQREEKSGDEIEIKIYAGKEPKKEQGTSQLKSHNIHIDTLLER